MLPHAVCDEQLDEQPVHAPQWQQVSQVRLWQVPQPVVLTVPRVQSCGVVHSQPLVQLPSQFVRPELQVHVPLEQDALAPQLLVQ